MDETHASPPARRKAAGTEPGYAETEPVRPDYGGACLTEIVPALLGDGEAPPWLPAPVAGARAVVLLVLDGLGWNTVTEHTERLPAIASLDGRAITTVCPSTTGSALTSLTTGLPPAEHGIVGYRIRIGHQFLNVLRWTTADRSRQPPPTAVAPHAAFLGRGVPVVTRKEFDNSGFSRAHLRGGRAVGWQTTAMLVEHCRHLVVEKGEEFVYAYYDGVDLVAHMHGLGGHYFDAELTSADRLVGDLLDALPDDAALLLTADHGQVQFGAEGWVGLQRVEALVTAYAGDGRFRNLYTGRGAADALLEACRDAYGTLAWVLSREQIIEEGWLGPSRPTREVAERVGDVVLAAREPVAFADPTRAVERHVIAGHGSMTREEMFVPLLAARGRAP